MEVHMKKLNLISVIIIGIAILLTSCQNKTMQISEDENGKVDYIQEELQEQPEEEQESESAEEETDASSQDILPEQSPVNNDTVSDDGFVDENTVFQFVDGKLNQLDANGNWIEAGNAQNNAADEELYRSFISQQFAGKENIRVALADLTHDGHEELIVVWYGEDEPLWGTHIYIYTIVQNQVREIEKKLSYSWRYELYLCIRNGKACLFEREHGIYQGEGDLLYKLYDFKPDYTENILDSYSIHVILDTTQGDKDFDLFMEKSDILTQEDVLVAHDDESELWPVNNVLRDDEAVYEGSCGDLVKENGVYHYSGIIEGYDESRATDEDWTLGIYELVRGDFYVDDSTKIVIESDMDYGFPAEGKSAKEWLDDFYARREYWMTLRIKVKGNHIEEIYAIYSIC